MGQRVTCMGAFYPESMIYFNSKNSSLTQLLIKLHDMLATLMMLIKVFRITDEMSPLMQTPCTVRNSINPISPGLFLSF